MVLAWATHAGNWAYRNVASLVNQRGEPLEDSIGQQIKTGSTVIHDFLGEGIAKGTIRPLVNAMARASKC